MLDRGTGRIVVVREREAFPRRGCKAAFYRGAFLNRCRPGTSHHGRGLELRDAGKAASGHFRKVIRPDHDPDTKHRAVPPVEAFANTSLGALLPASSFSAPLIPRKRPTFDWLYEAAQHEEILDRLLEQLGWTEDETRRRLLEERNHDLLEAFVCPLTAGFASEGSATVVGDEVGGWFWLPPISLWAEWALAPFVRRAWTCVGSRLLMRRANG